MGVDWHRMKPKPGTDIEELRRLAREEAVAYQSMYGWYPVHDTDPVTLNIQQELHSATWAAATAAIQERTEWGEWDEERGCDPDYPDLDPCWRVSVISSKPIFPPLVQCQAFRTILPDELPDQLTRWREWVEGVARGDHDDYLRELHWYSVADWARYHWSCLHAAAVLSLSATGKWASRPELVAVREEILRLPEPNVPSIAIAPGLSGLWLDLDRERLETDYPKILATARTLGELTRRWDRWVRGNRKLKYYESCYHLTLDEFRTHAEDEWLREFFAWAGRCAELGFGFCLYA